MFVEAVLSDHSLDTGGFTYFVPDFLAGAFAVGSVLEVPFGDDLEAAVVIAMDVAHPERAEPKSAVSVLSECPVLSKPQIAAAMELSRRYFVRPDLALSFFLPKPMLRRFLKTNAASDASKVPEWSRFDGEPNPRRTPVLAYDREGLGAAKLFGGYFAAEPGSVLILPSDSAVARFLRETRIPASEFLVHREGMTEAVEFRFRRSVEKRESPFLVWTRRLCSYNLAAYREIFYFEDQLFPDVRHKFFHAYSNLFILERLSGNGGPNLTVSSYLPSARSMAKTAEGLWNLENVTHESENP